MERKHWRMLWSPRTRGERELLPAWKEVRWNSEQKNIYLAGMPVKSLGNMIHLLIVLMNSFWFHLSWKLHVTALYNTQIERGLPSFFSYTISNEWNISAISCVGFSWQIGSILSFNEVDYHLEIFMVLIVDPFQIFDTCFLQVPLYYNEG
jgi:hypothetical protein